MAHSSTIADLVGSVIALLLLAVATLAFTKKTRLPFTVVLVVVGMGLAAVAGETPFAGLPLPELSPDLILYVFLPTLIFESTLNLDTRQLRHNLGAILTLAVPGLLLSTAIIGLIVWLATPIPLAAALLLGAILSATDPVAVVALFRQLGAPERLTVLVEGESLFNDATSIVLAGILIGVVAAGSVSAEVITGGIADFFLLFFGGLLTGVLLGYLISFVLGLIESDPIIEITLPTVLAYLSFLLAEEALHVSGVMATVGAGLTLGGWGRAKISPSVRVYLEHFWEQMAFIATALLFLMLGLRVELGTLWASLDLIGWVILAMVLARAGAIYGLMPLVGRIPGAKPVNLAYQTVMFWGGLRGAIAIAIVLSLPGFPYADTFVVLVMGAVLFSLLAQALTIESLVRRLGLDKLPLIDRLALFERDLHAGQRALQRIPQLQAGGLFSAPIAQRMLRQCEKSMGEAKHRINRLRRQEMRQSQEIALLYLRALSEEKQFYQEMYARGHLTEGAFRELVLVLILQIDAIRFHGEFEHIHSHRIRRMLERLLYRFLERFQTLIPIAERLRVARLIRNYEEVWGHYQSSGRVLEYLSEIDALESIPAEVMEEVRGHYRHWHELARSQIDEVSEQFPEFVNSMQERLGQRLWLQAVSEATREQEERGLLPHGLSDSLLSEIEHKLNRLRGHSEARLEIDAGGLLRKVPLFRGVPPELMQHLIDRLQPHTRESNETILEQGALGGSLFLIARGVVRVSREEGGELRDLGTLMAGDFFGEMALMHHESRNASVRTITPCQFYELQQSDLEELMQRYPELRKRIEQVDAERQRELHPR
ncbi:MAG TPA: cation:proton antiporter [Gammaproteobacteria bacterium]